MKIVVCPQCNFRFDISYGRALACGGCPSSILGDCGMARCPKCSYEFPISGRQDTQIGL